MSNRKGWRRNGRLVVVVDDRLERVVQSVVFWVDHLDGQLIHSKN